MRLLDVLPPMLCLFMVVRPYMVKKKPLTPGWIWLALLAIWVFWIAAWPLLLGLAVFCLALLLWATLEQRKRLWQK